VFEDTRTSFVVGLPLGEKAADSDEDERSAIIETDRSNN